MKNEDIKNRFGILRTDRSNVEGTWDIIEQFVVPFTGEMYNPQNNEGEINWRRREIFDSTAIMACQTLASSMHGSLTSPSTQWFGLQFSKSELNENVEASTWLQACERECFNEIQASNFNMEVNDLYLFLSSLGTGALVQEPRSDSIENWKGMYFSNVPIRECYFEEDFEGKAYRFYRLLQWTPIQMVSKFGKDNLPDCIREKLENPSESNVKEDVIFCIYKRDDGREGVVVPANERRWGYKYILLKDASMIGKEGGYYERPVYLPRWKRTSGSVWGYSPATISLSDILTLNQLVEMILKAAEKAIDPPYGTTERNLISDLDQEAGGLSIMRDPSKLVPMESRARFDVSQLQRDQLTSSIRSAFHVDQLELKDSPAMTATEVQVRYELMQRLLGPTLGQLQSDFLNPMVERTFGILMRAGRFPEIPQAVKEADPDIKIDYVGPLARSQKLDDVQATTRWLDIVAGLAGVKPEVTDIPNFDKIVRSTADQLGVPAANMNSRNNVEATREQRAKEMEEAAKAQQAMGAGEAMSAVGQGVTSLKEAGVGM